MSRPPSRRKSRIDAFSASPDALPRQQVPQPTMGIRSRYGVPGIVQTPQESPHLRCMNPGFRSHSPASFQDAQCSA